MSVQLPALPQGIGGPDAQALVVALNDRLRRISQALGSTGTAVVAQAVPSPLAVATAHTPASATDTGTTGQIAWDANFLYVCVATNTWKRIAIATW